MKIAETIFLMILMVIVVAAANIAGYKVSFLDSLLAALIIAAVALTGTFLGKIPLLNKLPGILWVSLMAAFVSSPVFPVSAFIVEKTECIPLLVVCTPVLTYAGLAIGKDLALFKDISWRIIPVSIAVFSGTFLFSAIIAYFTLQWDGVI